MGVKKLTISVLIFLCSVGAWAAWQDRTQLLTDPAGGDEVQVNDVSDTTDNAAGTVKRTSLTNLMKILGSLISDSGAFRVNETTSGAEWSIQLYDTGASAWRDCLTFTNGNPPTVAIGSYCSFSGTMYGTNEIDVTAASKYMVGGYPLINDSAGDGDTGNVYSADKIYDELVAKQDADYEAEGSNITTTTSITSADLGKRRKFTAEATATLPAASSTSYYGCVAFRVRDAAETATIAPQAGEIINLNGEPGDPGQAIEATGAGETVIMCPTTDTSDGSTDGWEAYGPTSGWAFES